MQTRIGSLQSNLTAPGSKRAPSVVARYQKRISRPLLDRMDIHVDMQRVNDEKLSGQGLGEPSAAVRKHCHLDKASQHLMRAAMRQLHLSARAYHRALKLARTIADLAGRRHRAAHLAEAIRCRSRRVE